MTKYRWNWETGRLKPETSNPATERIQQRVQWVNDHAVLLAGVVGAAVDEIPDIDPPVPNPIPEGYQGLQLDGAYLQLDLQYLIIEE